MRSYEKYIIFHRQRIKISLDVKAITIVININKN